MNEAFTRAVFDREWYLRANPDVAQARVNPLRHFIRHGAAEGRNPGPWLDSHWYLTTNADVRESQASAFEHFASAGLAEGRSPHPALSGHALWRRVLTSEPGQRRTMFLEVLPALNAYLDSGGFAIRPLAIPADGARWGAVLRASTSSQRRGE